MAYSEAVAQRVRDSIGSHPALTERKMFGGIAFMLNGNMACGVNGENIMLRVGKEAYVEELRQPGVLPIDMGGRVMKSFVYITPAACNTQSDFDAWVQKGVDFALSLPPKS